MAEAFGRRVRPVRRREGVVDPDVAEFCQFGDEGRIVLFFFLMETGVFQTKNVAVLHRGDGLLRRLADAIVGEADRLSDHLGKFGGDRLQQFLGIASLGPAEMREQDDLAALGGNLGDGGRDAFEPRGVGDAAIFHGHVEVDAQQDALALHVDVIEGAECFWHVALFHRHPSRIAVRRRRRFRSPMPGHPRLQCDEETRMPGTRPGMTVKFLYSSFPIATAVSAMRFEKPHSLSYQDITRTSVPFCTLVWSMWKVEECGSWLKSIETLGAVV